MSCLGRGTVLGAAVLLTTPFFAAGCGSDGDGTRERLGTRSDAIVGGQPSTPEDDFVVFLAHLGDPTSTCGATLVAPNLVVTAKHCVYAYAENASTCDGTGLPVANGEGGGYVGAPIKLPELAFYGGADAKNRVVNGKEAPAAVGARVIDDKSVYLCSHDLAYVVLDRPMTGLPIGKLRLGERPKPDTAFAVAGWGAVEDRVKPLFRQRRTSMIIARVGPVEPNAGAVPPRTFEGGPGPCTGDSGSPAFVLATGTALGVTARGLGFVLNDPVSPCAPSTVTSSFVDIVDFPIELRGRSRARRPSPGSKAPRGRASGASVRRARPTSNARVAGARARRPPPRARATSTAWAPRRTSRRSARTTPRAGPTGSALSRRALPRCRPRPRPPRPRTTPPLRRPRPGRQAAPARRVQSMQDRPGSSRRARCSRQD